MAKPIDPAEIVAGKPTKEEIFQIINDTLETQGDAIALLQGTSKIDIFDVNVSGALEQYSAAGLSSRMPVFKSPIDATVVSFVVTLLSASTSGTLQVEMDKSVDNGVNWTPLLTSPVEVNGITVGSVSGAVNWVDVPSQSFNQNDLLRIRITGVQVDQGNFHISVYGELA